MRTLSIGCAMAWLLCAGCGDTFGSGSTSFSCDHPATKDNSMMHICEDFTVTGGPNPGLTCANGSTRVSSCTRSGAVGACTAQPLNTGVYTTHSTVWYYGGDVAQKRKDCEQSGGTWMNP